MSMSRVSAKILSDPVNRWVFSNSGEEIYLVGGFLRDILLSRLTGDADYVVREDPEKSALRAARKFSGTLIGLKKNQTYRIVLPDRRSVDFSHLDTSISENLRKRDFTINAMAWGPSHNIVDPYGGLHDLKKKVIRAVARANLREDPLRILRAYRHALQLDFRIQSETRNGLRAYADYISEVAPERITDELCKILNHPHADRMLKICYDDGVLQQIVRISDDRLKGNLNRLRRYRLVSIKMRNSLKRSCHVKRFQHFLDEEMSQGLTRAGLIRLSILLSNGGYVKNSGQSFRFSSLLAAAIRSIHSGVIRAEGSLTEKKIYEIFRSSGRYPVETAHVISAVKANGHKRLLKSAQEYQTVSRKSLMSGDDIKQLLNLQPGVVIGKIKSELHERRFLKSIRTKADARAWLLSNYT